MIKVNPLAPTEKSSKHKRFEFLAWFVLGYTLFVILWGAFVRATGSGAGCGSHWPLCNGEVIPRSAPIETLIEFFHRVTSGLSGVLVAGLLVMAYRLYSPNSRVRKAAMVATVFIVIEALIGAGLVKFEWVDQDDSVGRAITIVVHLLNTFILLASLALAAWWASGGKKPRLQWRGSLSGILVLGVVGMLLVGASGALAALGDTLFPVQSLAEGIRMDFSPAAHYLIRLRLLHPTISAGVGMYLLVAAGYLRVRSMGNGTLMKLSRLLTIGVLLQLAGGVLNVLLLAPVWMQVIHLLLADAVWITLILTINEALAATEDPVEKVVPAAVSQVG